MDSETKALAEALGRNRKKIQADNLRRYRKERGLTLAALAEKSGVSIRALSNIENEKGEFYTSTFDKICDALGITIFDFWTEHK